MLARLGRLHRVIRNTRAGSIYRVDDTATHVPGAIDLTHLIGSVRESSFTHLIKRSVDILSVFREARSVSTTRLHCYLPCRALGTPVRFNAKTSFTNLDVRFEGLVGLDDDALDAMRDGLTELMHKTFSRIFSGADEASVYQDMARTDPPSSAA